MPNLLSEIHPTICYLERGSFRYEQREQEWERSTAHALNRGMIGVGFYILLHQNVFLSSNKQWISFTSSLTKAPLPLDF